MSRNQVHAAILRAELRGRTALAAELKQQAAESQTPGPASKRESGSSLSQGERNRLHARIMKAEMLGDAGLAQQLRQQLQEAESQGTATPRL